MVKSLSLWHEWLLAGEKTGKQLRLRHHKFSPAGKEVHNIFMEGGGKNLTFSKNILPWLVSKPIAFSGDLPNIFMIKENNN